MLELVPGQTVRSRSEEVLIVKVGRIVMIVVGALLALLGFGLLAGSTVGVLVLRDQRSDGYFRTGEVRLRYRDVRDHVGPGRPGERSG